MPTFAAVDWGTSSFRLWLFDRQGAVLGERFSDCGMSRLKPDGFGPILEDNLAELGVAADMPVVICGMAGAAQGWHPVPYLDVPAILSDVPANAAVVPGSTRDVRILPGLAQRESSPDVLRGEETILLGALLSENVDGLICMPGTHSKWVTVRDNKVMRFSTAMTGEIFALLARQSTLSHYLVLDGEKHRPSASFSDAVVEALEKPDRILTSLFSIRAAPLLFGDGIAKDLSGRLSGLLIGLELAGIRQEAGQGVTLVANGVLATSYATACDIAGIRYRSLDAQEMVRAGLCHAGNILWSNSDRSIPVTEGMW